jgi:ligand-binding sensor domain-containing protein/DNA-binding CsgD family transcriptional regulator
VVPVLPQNKYIGVPEIINIKREVYGADAQNWAIIEDDQGSIYLGNNAGVLKFNGEGWHVFPVENRSIVRSLAKGPAGEIYVGAYNEIGVLNRYPNGGQVYRSLNRLIPDAYRNFDDVWNIYATSEGIVFQSFEYLFIMRNDSLRVLQPEDRYGNSYLLGNQLFIVEKGVGLRVLRDGGLVTLSEDPIFTAEEIRALFLLDGDQIMVGTLNQGLLLMSEGELSEWETEVSGELRQNKLYKARLYGERYYFGTIRNGLYICNLEGDLLQNLNRSNGLQNNTILSLHIDRQYNTWLGLDNGVDYLKTSLPISFINYNFNIETVYASVVHRGRLYVGTNQGLYSKKLDELGRVSDIKFELVGGTEGQVWNLTVHDDQLLCGHHNGAYLIEGNASSPITRTRGVWNFHTLPERENLLISGTYDGLVILQKNRDGRWVFRNTIRGLDVSSKQLIIENESTLWMSHGYLGLYQMKINESLDSLTSLTKYYQSAGLPDSLPYLLHQARGQSFISTPEGIYRYNSETGAFNYAPDLNQFYSDLNLIYLIKEDQQGNLWYSSEQGMGVYRQLEDGTYSKITKPFLSLQGALVSSFDNIYIDNPEKVYIGTQNGLVHYDPTISKDYFSEISVFIDEVSISTHEMDSLWYFKGNESPLEAEGEQAFRVPFQFNTFSFSFHCADLENAGLVEYSYRLNDFDSGWSEWSRSAAKEYTNLREGSYFFEVRARNIYGNISEPDRFYFSIAPPFYRSSRAYALYFIFLLSLAGLLLWIYLKRIERVRSQEETRHLDAFREKEAMLQEKRAAAENEVTQLKNEKLVSEMKYKNKELVNSTFHLIQKNKFLNSLKQELSSLRKSAKSDFVEKELRKISRKIDRDIHNERNWEVFERYFDEVHQEFLNRLKQKHPGLSPTELRLCAYLRMNISTKEIAPLMNISVRGVEISRYRLRKKLNLPHQTNLVAYIMSI